MIISSANQTEEILQKNIKYVLLTMRNGSVRKIYPYNISDLMDPNLMNNATKLEVYTKSSKVPLPFDLSVWSVVSD